MLRYASKPARHHRRPPGAAIPVQRGVPEDILPPKRSRGAKMGTLVGVRLQPDLLARLDHRAKGMTRPEAIRRILEKHL